jgi:hypothetical protein
LVVHVFAGPALIRALEPWLATKVLGRVFRPDPYNDISLS